MYFFFTEDVNENEPRLLLIVTLNYKVRKCLNQIGMKVGIFKEYKNR